MVEFVFEILIRLIAFFIVLPVWLVVASPVIWVVALFRAGSYWENVRGGYDWAIDMLGGEIMVL